MTDTARAAALSTALLAAGVLYAIGWRWPLDRLERWANGRAAR
jgi:hypothetical protein